MKKTLVTQFVFAAMMFALAGGVYAQLTRNFPPDSKLGELTAINYPTVEISGQTLRLSPGGQIRGKNNLIVMPTAVTEGGTIRYQLEFTGYVRRIWLLTPEEVVRAREEEKNKPNPKQ
ncbi:MAG: hypothetical protein Q7J38_16680 [Gallionella sp.]|nr:hypothetical protein [Gallionella sp.]